MSLPQRLRLGQKLSQDFFHQNKGNANAHPLPLPSPPKRIVEPPQAIGERWTVPFAFLHKPC